MSDPSISEPEATTASKPRPPRFGHRSTWVMVLIVFLVLLFANIPGSYSHSSYWPPSEINHGWPWVYLERMIVLLPGCSESLWQIGDEPTIFHASGAFGNIIVGLTIMLGVGVVTEWRRRRRNRFWQVTLSECLFAVLLLAACSAAWGWLLKESHRQAAAIAALKNDVSVSAQWEFSMPDWWTDLVVEDPRSWPRHVVEISLSNGYRYPPPSIDSLLKCLHQFPRLRTLYLGNATVDDPRTWERLQDCSGLQSLHLWMADLTDAALDPISRISTLVDLNIRNISNNNFTDEGVKKLQSLKHLKCLNLNNTGASDEAIDALRQALPELTINVNYSY